MDNAAIRESFASSIYEAGVNFARESVLKSIPSKLAQMHISGDIHIHDMESFDRVYNCCTPDLYQYLSTQEYMGISETGIIFQIFERIKLLITNLANCQAGGIGFGNFDDDIGRIFASLSIKESKDNIVTLREAIRFFLYWVNHSYTRFCRETYYITLNIGLSRHFWGRQVSLILIDEFMEAPKSFTKPNIVFKVSSEINSNPESVNYDLYIKSLSCTAKRMIPTYLLMDSPVNNHCEKTNLNIMGCRTRIYDNVNGNPGTVGRGNIAYVSINLPRIALRSNGKGDFYEKLLETMNYCVDILRIRQEKLKKTSGSYLKYILEQHIWDHVSSVQDMILSGSYSIGFIGLSEAVEVLTGAKFYIENNSYETAKDIVAFMNEFVMSLRNREKMNYSLLATPGEMLSGRFSKLDKDRYPHFIQEKGFYTNSFHVEVDSKISIFKKIELEGYFHLLCNGGAITYIEFPSAILQNVEALSDAIKFAEKSGISYLGFNFPLDICNQCGQDGTFDTCPVCGSDNILRVRRVSGYLENVEYFTEGKKAEVKKRKANT